MGSQPKLYLGERLSQNLSHSKFPTNSNFHSLFQGAVTNYPLFESDSAIRIHFGDVQFPILGSCWAAAVEIPNQMAELAQSDGPNVFKWVVKPSNASNKHKIWPRTLGFSSNYI